MKKVSKKRKRIIFIILTTLMLTATVSLAFNLKRNIKSSEGKNTEKEIVVSKGCLKKDIETTGKIIPNIEVEIKCKASGEIIGLPVDISDTVKAGELLLQLDPEDEETSVKQAEVSLAISKAEYEQAKLKLSLAIQELETEKIRTIAGLSLAEAQKAEYESKYKRAKALNEKNIISNEIYETAYTAYVNACSSIKNAEADVKNLKSLQNNIAIIKHNIEISKAKVESSQLSLKDAVQRLKDVTVTAPINGVISEQNVQKGQIIASGVNNVDGGTTIMSIADLSKIFVLASVDESNIGRIKKGQKAEISVEAYPELTFPGEVVRIATTGKTVSSVVTFEVKIEVKGNKFSLLKSGMTADIKITVLEKSNVITIPIAAVSRKLTKRYAIIKNETGNHIKRLISVGENNGEKIEITSGINIGEVVIVPDKSESKWSSNYNKRNFSQEKSNMETIGGVRI